MQPSDVGVRAFDQTFGASDGLVACTVDCDVVRLAPLR